MARKEMIPAPVREVLKTATFCKPEWDLLCGIRKKLQSIKGVSSNKTMFRDIKSVLKMMNEIFDDWPEDSK